MMFFFSPKPIFSLTHSMACPPASARDEMQQGEGLAEPTVSTAHTGVFVAAVRVFWWAGGGDGGVLAAASRASSRLNSVGRFHHERKHFTRR